MTAPPIQSVAIPTFERREEPTPHVVYVIHVRLADKSWEVRRRYSEFAALNADLTPPAPPAPLPPKNLASHSFRLLTGLGGLLPASESQRQAEEEAAHERREGLEHYLRAILSARNDRWRADPRFLHFLQVSDHMERARSYEGSRSLGYTPKPGSLHETRARPDVLRPWTVQRPVQETDATRPLSDAQLMRYQTDTQMKNQDAQAEQLARILQRQRHLGLAINDELNEQSELLDHLNVSVQNTRSRMDTAQERMKRLE